MDVFWNYTMHIGDSKLCCFHSPTSVSTLQTWLTTFRPGDHALKSQYRDFAVSSSLNILRTKTGEHDNAVKHLKRSKLYTTYSIPGGSVTTPRSTLRSQKLLFRKMAEKIQLLLNVSITIMPSWQPCFQQRSRSQCLNKFNTVVI